MRTSKPPLPAPTMLRTVRPPPAPGPAEILDALPADEVGEHWYLAEAMTHDQGRVILTARERDTVGMPATHSVSRLTSELISRGELPRS